MSRFECYNELKNILSKNGAIPFSEDQYQSLINELMLLFKYNNEKK